MLLPCRVLLSPPRRCLSRFPPLPPLLRSLCGAVFSIRQHEVAADVQFIGSIEQKIGSVVMVLDPWYEPVCLNRVW